MQRLSQFGFPRISYKMTLIFILLTFTLLPIVATYAQEGGEEGVVQYVSRDGSVSLEYPESWFLESNSFEAYIAISDKDYGDTFFSSEDEDAIAVVVYLPDGFRSTFPDIEALPTEPSDLVGFLSWDIYDAEIFTDIEEGTLGEQAAVFANYSHDDVNGQVIVVELGKGDLAAFIGITTTDDYAPFEETVFAIADSTTLLEYEADDLRVVTSPNLNLRFEMPVGYVYNDTDDEGSITFGTNEEVNQVGPREPGQMAGVITTEVFFTNNFDVAEAVVFENPEEALMTMNDFVISFVAADGTVSDIEVVTPEDEEGFEYVKLTFESDVVDGVAVAIELSDGRIITSLLIVPSGELAESEELLLQILTSVDVLSEHTMDAEN